MWKAFMTELDINISYSYYCYYYYSYYNNRRKTEAGNTVSEFFFKILFIYFRERGREGEREGEKHQCVVASCVPPTRDLACNPGVCPDWESTWRPFGSQAGTQSTEPHQPGPMSEFVGVFWIISLDKVHLSDCLA